MFASPWTLSPFCCLCHRNFSKQHSESGPAQACLPTCHEWQPSIQGSMWKALSLPCDTFCSCDRTLCHDWTHVTGLTSHPPLFYSSELVWHSNTPSPRSCSCSTAEEAAGCVFPQCSDTKACKWKYINSDPGDESSRNEEQEHSSAMFAKHFFIHQKLASCTLQNQICLFLNCHCFVSSQMCSSKMQRAYILFSSLFTKVS